MIRKKLYVLLGILLFAVVAAHADITMKAMQATPLDRLFLETDNSASEISEIYESAAKTLGITKTNLAKIIENNYTRLYSNEKEKPE